VEGRREEGGEREVSYHWRLEWRTERIASSMPLVRVVVCTHHTEQAQDAQNTEQSQNGYRGSIRGMG
jgi:hypothetical protein